MSRWVGKNLSNVLLSPTVTTSAYAEHECVGTLGTVGGTPQLKSGGSGRIVHATLYDLAAVVQNHTIVLWLFRSNPSASTFTDNAAFAVNDADLDKVAAVIPFDQAHGAIPDLSSGSAVIDLPGISYPYIISGETMYYIFKTGAGSTPTFVAGADLSCRLHFERN